MRILRFYQLILAFRVSREKWALRNSNKTQDRQKGCDMTIRTSCSRLTGGRVSRAMLTRYSHVRMEAKRRALDVIAAQQKAAEEKRKEEAEKAQQPPAPEAMISAA